MAGISNHQNSTRWRSGLSATDKRFFGKPVRHFPDHGATTRDETSWKNPAQLLELLIESVSKGGNLLLNVGPTARGLFDYRAQERLKAMGEWMKIQQPIYL